MPTLRRCCQFSDPTDHDRELAQRGLGGTHQGRSQRHIYRKREQLARCP